jgi:hypothetical protein
MRQAMRLMELPMMKLLRALHQNWQIGDAAI